jgi:hypothetical protein
MSKSEDEIRFEGQLAERREWIRVLTGFFPEMKLLVYSPREIGTWLKENLEVRCGTR